MNTEDGIAQESVLPFSMYRYVALCLPQAPFEITSCHLCISLQYQRLDTLYAQVSKRTSGYVIISLHINIVLPCRWCQRL